MGKVLPLNLNPDSSFARDPRAVLLEILAGSNKNSEFTSGIFSEKYLSRSKVDKYSPYLDFEIKEIAHDRSEAAIVCVGHNVFRIGRSIRSRRRQWSNMQPQKK